MAGIALQLLGHGGGEAGIAAGHVLQLDDERHAAADQRQQRVERRHALLRAEDAQPPELGRRAGAHAARFAGQAGELVVMKDDRHAVGGEVQVALDRISGVDRRREGGERVLRPSGRKVVKPAMRDRPRREPAKFQPPPHLGQPTILGWRAKPRAISTPSIVSKNNYGPAGLGGGWAPAWPEPQLTSGSTTEHGAGAWVDEGLALGLRAPNPGLTEAGVVGVGGTKAPDPWRKAKHRVLSRYRCDRRGQEDAD